MNIVFEKIEIHDFMCIKDATLNLEDRGTILVKGINEEDPLTHSNGSGKSVLTCESLLWCLTGKTNKKTKQIASLYIEDAVARVKVYFRIDNDKYEVERTQAMTKSLNIVKNGVNISGNTYTKSEEILSRELGFINEEVLTSVVILGQGLEGRFSTLPASYRKSRLEYIVGIDSLLDNIVDMVSKTEDKISNLLTAAQLAIKEQETIIDTSNQILDNYKDRDSISEEEYERNKEECNKLADEGNELANTVKQLKADVDRMNTEKNDLLKSQMDILKEKHLNESKLSAYNTEVDKQTNKLNDLGKQLETAQQQECPLCHQHLEDTTLVEHITQEVNKINESIKELNTNTNITQLQNTIQECNVKEVSIQEKINNISAEINVKNDEINTKNSRLNEITVEYNKYQEFFNKYDRLKIEADSIDNIINDCNTKIANAKLKLKELEENRDKLENDKNINKFFKNQVSKKFRNFLLEGVFEYLNNRLKYYSSKLFTNYVISLESKGNDINIWLSEKEFSALSGGEKQKTDLAIQFALRDLARNQRGLSCNIIQLDEVFDGLDALGIETMVKFIEEELQDIRSMFIISHMKYINIGYDGVVEVVKHADKMAEVREYK